MPHPTADDHVEPIYLELAKRVMGADSYWVPRVLKKVLTLREAEIARELPAPLPEVAAKLGLSESSLAETVRELIRKGCLVKIGERIKPLSNLSQLGDILVANPAYDKERGDEFFQLMAGLCSDEALGQQQVQAYSTLQPGGGPLARVIPRWKAIKNIPGVMPCEDVRELLRPEDGKLHTTRCFCRTIFNSRHCAVHEGTYFAEGHCVHFGVMADYYVEEMGIGKLLSTEEVMSVVDDLDKSPTYHMVGNSRDVKWLCNCCACCCAVAKPFRASKTHGIKDAVAPSRFLCVGDKTRCDGCEVCLGKCPFDAIEMVQGKAVVHPEKCMGCGACVLNCRPGALKLKLVRPPDFIPERGVDLVELFILENQPLPAPPAG